MPRIQRLWVNLSLAIIEGHEGDGIHERLSIPPWKSADTAVIEAWRELTSAGYLADLLASGQGALNPHAREFTDQAIKACLAACAADAGGVAGARSDSAEAIHVIACSGCGGTGRKPLESR
jgi:hypothetical protein